MRNVSGGIWSCLLSCRFFLNAGTEGRATLFDRLPVGQPRAKINNNKNIIRINNKNKPDLLPKVPQHFRTGPEIPAAS